MNQPGDPHRAPSAPRKGGPGVFGWLAIAGGGIYVLAIAGVIGFSVYRGVRKGLDQVEAQRLATAASGAVADEESPAPAARPALPPVTRHVPRHAIAMLDGCADGDLAAIHQGISDAIDVGAPLYNDGNFAGCYHMYEGAAVDIERRLGALCEGPRRALDAGRSHAAALASPSAQAWAMRDAFDGLLDVIGRRGKGI